MLISVNMIIGDAIVLWRMNVLCRRHTYARAVAAVLLISTIAISVLNVVKDLAAWGKDPTPLSQFYDASASPSAYATATLALSLATNAISTTTIGWKMWSHRRDIAVHLGTFSHGSIAAKAMSVLVESGCIYCIIWVRIPTSTFSEGAVWFGRLMPQLTGIYPTSVLVLVALEQSYIETEFCQSEISAFVSARPRSQVTMERRPYFDRCSAIGTHDDSGIDDQECMVIVPPREKGSHDREVMGGVKLLIPKPESFHSIHIDPDTSRQTFEDHPHLRIHRSPAMECEIDPEPTSQCNTTTDESCLVPLGLTIPLPTAVAS
ncbi:hypothetical protein PENSPDRAFT_607382 [Peniophora sp. CONT]|nr:hypothetical protein PENSPDRAFT_607382 [Peniophora sp. CONT]